MTSADRVRVLFHFDAPESLQRRLEPLLDGLDVSYCAEEDEDRFLQLMSDAEVLWHVLRPITAQDMDGAPKLRLVQKLGSGLNTIDLDAARSRGIAVANMPGTNAPAVAESTLALMLATLRSLLPQDMATRSGNGWPIDTSIVDRVGELGTRTVGLIGYGNIARRVEAACVALGARVLHSTRTDDGTPGWRPLDDLLAASDVVSVHVPLTAATERLLDERRLGLLPRGAIVVNTSRGPIVDEEALTRALRSGHLAGAGLDVFAHEPVDITNPLLHMEQVVVSPHTAWLTPETLERCVHVAAVNARKLAAGEELDHRAV